jgi:hypothetical protein
MVSFKNRQISSAWIVGTVVFVLTMVITFADVYGFDRFEYTRPGGGEVVYSDDNASEHGHLMISDPVGGHYDPCLPAAATVPTIPEPATFILFALGCGALLAGKRK